MRNLVLIRTHQKVRIFLRQICAIFFFRVTFSANLFLVSFESWIAESIWYSCVLYANLCLFHSAVDIGHGQRCLKRMKNEPGHNNDLVVEHVSATCCRRSFFAYVCVSAAFHACHTDRFLSILLLLLYMIRNS